MAYKRNYLDEQAQQQGQMTAGGGVLAGNSGSGPAPTQQQGAGSGWTNLNTYLEMNQGQTGGLADTYVGANQKIVDDAKGLGADLVKNTQSDKKFTEQTTQAQDLAGQIKSGDLTKVDANQFKTIMGSGYQKPQSYGELKGYQDVLGAFSKAGERVEKANDYGTQASTLRNEFSKGYQGYNSGMGTLDTFLLRGDKDASAKTQAFQQANQNFVPTKNADGTQGSSAAMRSMVSDPLAKFFTDQETSFNTAKQELGAVPGQRRGVIESSVTPAMLAAKRAEIDAANQATAASMAQRAQELGILSGQDFTRYGGVQGTLDAADLMSDADWQALAVLEGLDGGRSSIQDQQRGDFAGFYDREGADALIKTALDKKVKEEAAARIAALPKTDNEVVAGMENKERSQMNEQEKAIDDEARVAKRDPYWMRQTAKKVKGLFGK